MKIKRFSRNIVLNPLSSGFVGKEKDQDFFRLGKLKTQRELKSTSMGKELRKLNLELNKGRTKGWHDTE